MGLQLQESNKMVIEGSWKEHFDLERIFIPINIGNLHWVLGVIHIEKMLIEHYDSQFGEKYKPNIEKRLNVMPEYEIDEYKTKFGYNMDVSKWKLVPHVKRVPQQLNGELYFWRY